MRHGRSDLRMIPHAGRGFYNVAIAVKWGCELFVTVDGRQAKAAKIAGIKAFDLRGKP